MIERDRSRLGTLGSRIVYFPSIGSTNDVAASLLAAGAGEGAVVLADQQTSGRGRLGRTWFSPPGSGLYVSVVLEPARSTQPVRATMLVTLAAATALAEAVETVTALGIEIKWPNDLLVDRRKVAGILAEGVASGDALADRSVEAVVLGYGINVGLKSYPPDLSDRATSLETELGRPVDRALLFGETLVRMARRYEDLLSGRFDAILDAWRARAHGSRGTRVTWRTPAGLQAGVTVGVDEEGALLVQIGGRVERIVSGEVNWL